MIRSGNRLQWFVDGNTFYPVVFLFTSLILLAGSGADWHGETSPLERERKRLRISLNPVTIKKNNSVQSNLSSNRDDSDAANSSETADMEGIFDRYLSEIVREVERKKRYPDRELKQGKEGSVKVRLHIARDGSLKDVEVIEPGPTHGFTREALLSVKRAAPFKPFSSEIHSDSLSLVIRIYFKMAS